MRANEFILTESRNYLCEAYQRQAVTLIEQFCEQSVTNKFTPRQIFEMFEAVPTTGQPAAKDAVALQRGKKVLGKAKASLTQGIQRTGEKVQNFDEKFDAYATKLSEKFPATNKVIQAFRKWGHENPVAEHAILFALGTAATVVAPGVIGAAVAVGLLTTAYKLIMGKKFSQSVKAGAAAGLIAGALSSAVHGVEALAHAHHASPALTKGAESIAHGAIEHTAGDTIGDIAAKGADMVGDLAKSSSGIRAATSAARAGNYGSALKQVAAT